MMKDDGTLRYRGRITPLMEILLRRRSCRKYAQGTAPAEGVARIAEAVESARSSLGLERSRIQIVGRGETFDAVVRAAMAGVVGKVNPWLPSTRASHLILCGAVYADSDPAGVRERAIKEAAVAMQVAVLAASEQRLATCWMAGINHERVDLAFPMPDGARVIALSTLGFFPERKGISVDALIYHAVSKRRRPLEAIWMRERWSEER